MSSGVPPAFPGTGGPLPLLSRSLWSGLERLFPSSTGALTLFPRGDPETGRPAYWSPELSLLLPPLPGSLHVQSSIPLRAVAVREGADWMIRAPYREIPSAPERILEWRIPGAGGGDQRLLLSDSSRDSRRDLPGSGMFRSQADPVLVPDLFLGPFPSDPSVTMKPETCLLEIRWPAPDPVTPDEGNSPEHPEADRGVPFRLEVRFPGGETAVVGGVYESRKRFLSVSARLSSPSLSGFWNRSFPEMARDLSEVFRIRLEGRSADEGDGS